MDETLTQSERLVERQEELTREYLERLTPQLEKIVASIVDARMAQFDALARANDAKLRTDVTGWTNQFATHEEAAQIGDRVGDVVLSKLTGSVEAVVNRRFDDIQKNFATKDELQAVSILAIGANDKLTTLEATTQLQIDTLKERVGKVEDTQKEQFKTIQDIRLDTEKIGKSADKMSTAFIEQLERDEKHRKETEREIDLLKVAQAQDVKELREIREDIAGIDSDVTGLRGDIATQVNTTRQNVTTMKDKVDGIDARQTRTEIVVNEIQVSLQSALWLVNTRVGNAIVLAIIALLVGSNFVK